MATERIIEHVERLRQHPEHVRYRIAMGTAFAVTALVAVGWAVALTTSGTLALKDPEPVAAGPTPESELAKSFSETGSAFNNLMGAAGAAFGATSTEAALRIIDTRTSSTISEEETGAGASATVISF